MIALQCLSHVPISLLNQPSSPSRIKPCNSIRSVFCPNNFTKTRNEAVSSSRRKSKSRDGFEPFQESSASFFDENGAVDDMDGYLNYLSLEYDSVWDTKPKWCQPWTITLTGVGIITCSWLILNSTIITSLVAMLIFAWWYIFLYSYPKAYSDMIADRRNKVTNGSEDTYGAETQQ